MTEQPDKVGHGSLLNDGASLTRVSGSNIGQCPGGLKLELAIVVTRQEADKPRQNVSLCENEALSDLKSNLTWMTSSIGGLRSRLSILRQLWVAS